MSPLREEGGRWTTAYEACEQCGGQYLSQESHLRGQRHTEWERGELEIPVPSQPKTQAFIDPPSKVVFGEVATCTKCKGLMPRKIKGKPLTKDQMFTRDPRHRAEPCPRCNGIGYVPNVAT